MLIWNLFERARNTDWFRSRTKVTKACGLDSTINQKMVVGWEKQQKIRRIKMDRKNIKKSDS